MVKAMTKKLSLLLSVLMVLLAAAACGGTTTETDTATGATSAATTAENISEADKYPLPKVLEWSGGNWGWQDPVPEKDITVKEISTKFGTEIKATSIKVGSYNDLIKKMQMWASTGMTDWPQIFACGTDGTAKDIVNRLGNEGKLIDWMPYLKQMPEVDNALKILYPSVLTDGHIYGLPIQYSDIRVSPSNVGVYMRKDWLEQLNIPWPKTIPELEQALLKIKDGIKTPDGKAVVPMSLFGEAFTNLVRYFYPNNMEVSAAGNTWYWDEQKQEAVNADMEDTSYLIHALKWHNKIYNEGLIPQDCFTLKEGQISEMASQGKVGAVYGVDWGVGPYVQAISKDNPNAMFCLTPQLYEPSVNTEPAKPLTPATPYVLFTIKADAPKEVIYGFMKYIQWSMTKEGTLITNYGVEGVHWEYDKDGKVVDTADCAARLKGDWSLRAEEGIGIYGTAFNYDVLAEMNTSLDINGINMPQYMKESYKNQGYVTLQGYSKNPNFYITPGPEELKRTVGAGERFNAMVVKAVTGDEKDIESVVKAWHDAEYNMGYEEIKKERTELCKKMDMSYLQ